jgi:hypothetical protein
MMRAPRFFVVIALAISGALGCAGALGFASEALAADSFTIDDIPGGIVDATSTSVTFTGTVSTIDDDLDIVLFIDGHLLTCGEEFGNDIDDFDCLRTWTVEGLVWDFSVRSDELERLGLEFIGSHEVRFALTRWHANANKTIEAEKTMVLEFRNEASQASPLPSLEPDGAPGRGGPALPTGSSSTLASGNPASTSVLSSVRTVMDVPADPVNILVTAAVAIILLLLVGLPSALLGQTLSENYDRLFGKVTAAVRHASHALASPALPRWLPITFGIMLATVISAFVDPGFGWNHGSARMLASLGIAFVLESVVGWMVIRAVLSKTDPDLDPKPEFKFGSLLIVLIAVIVSRVVGFEPGMVFGLVVGLTFGASLASARDARVKLVGLAWAFAIGTVGWLAYSLLAGLPGWLPVFAAETFSAIAVSALAALPVALLPLAGLDGGVLFRWNRMVWAGIYAVALFAFFFVLMPMPFSWGEVGTPLATWVGLYLAYAVFAIAVWAWFRFVRPQSTHPHAANTESMA